MLLLANFVCFNHFIESDIKVPVSEICCLDLDIYPSFQL